MAAPIYQNIHQDLAEVSELLEGSWGFNRVVICRDSEGLFRTRGWNFQQLIPAIFSCFLTASYMRENRATLDYFREIFGRKRVQEISRRHGLDLDFKYNHGVAISKFDVEVLFGAMGDVRVGDIQTIFRELIQARDTYLHLTPERTADLKRRFQTLEFQQLSKSDIDELYNIAVPFQDLAVMFMNEASRDYVHFADRDYTWQGTKTRIYLMEEMRRSRSDNHQFECNMRTIKRILDYHTPTGERDGLLLWDLEGYRYVHKRIEGGGAYKFLLKALTKTDAYRSQISYIGTQFMSYVPSSWESAFEDFRENIGSCGPVATYEETRYFLENPSAGFVDNPGEKIDFIGMSLGGAQALRDSCLFIHQARKITAVCNPGVDVRTYEWFAAKTRELSSRISLEYIWEKEDLISLLGDGNLGIGCDAANVDISVKILSLISADTEVSPVFPERPHRPESTWSAMQRVWQSLHGAHIRETTAGIFRRNRTNRHLERTYRTSELTNLVQENAERLDRDILTNHHYGWEQIRRDWFGWIASDDRYHSLLERVHPISAGAAA
ncbi:MAG: hypothetical protein KAR79_01880 [Simkaniaceae bacterium]|nr:hypothetical protein [Simkaniaceae bacterium]